MYSRCICPESIKPKETRSGKSVYFFIMILFCISAEASSAFAQAVLFDFDNAPLRSPLPIDQTSERITAHLSATGQGYSIQDANVLGFTPQGFSGLIISPSSIELSDLLISFDQQITDFSIMYSCQELGCDDAATMRVTAYKNGAFTGTNTKTAAFPGTWPVDTLACSFSQGFDSVVIHYDSKPPTCQDYGVIYMADNMVVTPLNTTAVSEGGIHQTFALRQNYPNPFNPNTTISFQLPVISRVSLKVYNLLGSEAAVLLDGVKSAGIHFIEWNAKDMPGGIYFYHLQAGSFKETKKLVLLK